MLLTLRVDVNHRQILEISSTGEYPHTIHYFCEDNVVVTCEDEGKIPNLPRQFLIVGDPHMRQCYDDVTFLLLAQHTALVFRECYEVYVVELILIVFLQESQPVLLRNSKYTDLQTIFG